MQRVIVIELLSLANCRFDVSKTLGQHIIVILLTRSTFCVCGALSVVIMFVLPASVCLYNLLHNNNNM